MLESGLQLLDYLCTPVRLPSYKLLLQHSRTILDPDAKSAHITTALEQVSSLLQSAQPLRHHMVPLLMTALDQVRMEHLPSFTQAFGSRVGTELHDEYIDQYQNYIAGVVEVMTGFEVEMEDLCQSDPAAKIIWEDMPNKFFWLVKSPLLSSQMVCPSTPLPVLTPGLVLQLTHMLHDHSDALAEVSLPCLP